MGFVRKLQVNDYSSKVELGLNGIVGMDGTKIGECVGLCLDER